MMHTIHQLHTGEIVMLQAKPVDKKLVGQHGILMILQYQSQPEPTICQIKLADGPIFTAKR